MSHNYPLIWLGCFVVLTLFLAPYAHAHSNSYEQTMESGPGSQGYGHHHGVEGARHHQGKVEIDEEHIKEHLDGVADITQNMTQEELEFHYFKLHDFDNNTRLDGLEIYKALTHLLPFDDVIQDENLKLPEGLTPEQQVQYRRNAAEQYYIDIVDQVLEEDDIDNDGYLTYLEYALARRRAEMHEQREARRAQQADSRTHAEH